MEETGIVEVDEHIVLEKFEGDKLVETVIIENGEIIETIKEE